MSANTKQVEPIETWQAGRAPPSVPDPDEATAVLDAVGSDQKDAETVGVVRIRLESSARWAVDAFLDELDGEPTVRAVEPGDDHDSPVVDLLVDRHHDPRTVTAALASSDDVVGVAVATYRTGSLVDRPSSPRGVVRSGDVGEPIDVRGTFESLKTEVDQVDYDDLVAELDSEPFASGHLPEVDGERSTTGGDPPDGRESATAASDGGPPIEDGETAGPDGTDATPALDPEAVLRALVTALESEATTDEQRASLRSALDGESRNGLRAQVDHLQKRVNRLAAYTDALEAFLDERGTGERLIAEFEMQVEEAREEVDSLDEEFDELRARVDRHGERLDRVESTVPLDERLAGVTDDVDELRSWRQRLTEAFDLVQREG